jgi:hypothetical protein
MVNTNMHVFKHPKYYKELRDAGNELAKRNAVRKPGMSGSSPARNKSDQAISRGDSTEAGRRASDPGHMLPDSTMVKQRASSSTSRDQEHQASTKLVNACIDQEEPQAPSTKPQAPGFKHK